MGLLCLLAGLTPALLLVLVLLGFDWVVKRTNR